MNCEDKIAEAIAMLEENIATVPPHGCRRDDLLSLLRGDD
jgi:hypothetical protein